jgi:hypothetical protein
MSAASRAPAPAAASSAPTSSPPRKIRPPSSCGCPAAGKAPAEGADTWPWRSVSDKSPVQAEP